MRGKKSAPPRSVWVPVQGGHQDPETWALRFAAWLLKEPQTGSVWGPSSELHMEKEGAPAPFALGTHFLGPGTLDRNSRGITTFKVSPASPAHVFLPSPG